MTASLYSAPPDSIGDSAPRPLTHGLGRNTFFNVLGWAGPVVLYLVATPLIVHGLGSTPYGIFGLASVVSGYLAFLATSNATGNVRFLADAYGRQAWDDFRELTFAGVAV